MTEVCRMRTRDSVMVNAIGGWTLKKFWHNTWKATTPKEISALTTHRPLTSLWPYTPEMQIASRTPPVSWRLSQPSLILILISLNTVCSPAHAHIVRIVISTGLPVTFLKKQSNKKIMIRKNKLRLSCGYPFGLSTELSWTSKSISLTHLCMFQTHTV